MKIFESAERMSGILLRYFYLHKRSLPRFFEIVFWPVMELFLWGFVTLYIQSIATGTLGHTIVFLINAMIFWDILYRSQQAVSIAVIEDIWTQNIVNILISPLRIGEWILSTFIYGFLKTGLIVLLLSVLAVVLYQFNLVDRLGFYAIPLVLNLLLFGWALGMATSALVLRYGHSAEALIWGIPFLVQPVSAIFYPLSVLPPAVQLVSKLLPSTYVFEGMRAVIAEQRMPTEYFWSALFLNGIYFVLAALFFRRMYESAREKGRLGRLGMD